MPGTQWFHCLETVPIGFTVWQPEGSNGMWAFSTHPIPGSGYRDGIIVYRAGATADDAKRAAVEAIHAEAVRAREAAPERSGPQWP